jgi:ribosomal protein S18 acetylase RimI-like enzyme
MKPEILIRLYQGSDRAAVFRIGADTAFFGAPVEAYLDDRNLFLDAFYAYYLDFEPDHTWIATAGGEVVGFLTGCVDTRLHDNKLLGRIVPRVTWNLLHGRYHIGKLSLNYIAGMLEGLLRGEFTHVNLKSYPAHLHINIESAWRGRHMGKRLMEAWLGQLRPLSIPGVHLNTTSWNLAACHLYEKMNFQLLDARPDRFWTNWFGQPVENRCYGLLT